MYTLAGFDLTTLTSVAGGDDTTMYLDHAARAKAWTLRFWSHPYQVNQSSCHLQIFTYMEKIRKPASAFLVSLYNFKSFLVLKPNFDGLGNYFYVCKQVNIFIMM
jgi:hypothetical protein